MYMHTLEVHSLYFGVQGADRGCPQILQGWQTGALQRGLIIKMESCVLQVEHNRLPTH